FESYVEQILIRNLRAGQTVILDNISFHKTPRVRILIESVGCKVLYLPTYSPDLNPIEHYWFKIKHNIRKISHMFTDFSDAVCFILKNVSTFVY
ncbi:transposase, partial [Wolbachia endosymbiont of Bemisia tabaci]